MHIVLIAYYYPPINSSGAKRVEALSKYFCSFGHEVTVVTTRKTLADGEFTEVAPQGVTVVEMDWLGRERPSIDEGAQFEPMFTGAPSWRRRIKDAVMRIMGQIPDPRLPFSLSFLSPWLARRAKDAFASADVIIGTTPPWPMLLAALLCKLRFGKPCILDYRDHFSECHEVPGSRVAKWAEKVIDRQLVRNADHVVCISDPMTKYYSSLTSRVTTILNGYDHELLESARTRAPLVGSKIRIRYMGLVSPGRVPHHLLQALVLLRKEQPALLDRLSFEFFGNAALIQEVLQTTYKGIETSFSFFPSVPYLDSLAKITEADYLLFSETSSQKTLSAQGILTTKLFEYIGSGRPILADISQETLAGGLLGRCGGHHVIGQSPEIFLAALKTPSFFTRQADLISPLSISLSRKAQAQQYIALAERVAGNNKLEAAHHA